MSKLNVVTGDLLQLAREGNFDIIVQGCNCFCTMGSGIARQIREQYPEAYEADCKTIIGDRSKLGTATCVNVKDGFTIVNAYTQFGFNTGGNNEDVFEYDAFGELLENMIAHDGNKRFGFPAIGMGLAGGNKEKITAMLEAFAEAVEADNGSATLVIYDK